MLDSYWIYRNKLTNKLFGVAHMPSQKPQKGNVLLSYLVSPFTKKDAPGDPHANYWECREIARLFSQKGYDIDIIDWNNSSFIPRKKYAVCIDIQNNLERLKPYLGKDCVSVMHIVSSYTEFQNKAEQKRLDDLKTRRGITLLPQRRETVSKNPLFADHLEGFGNKTVYATYEKFGKEIFPIHESVTKMFDFPKNKDFESAKKHFLWFGGGGAIHKGLDLVLEAFTALPHFHLHIIGPIRAERDFMKAFEKELGSPNITLYNRPKIDQDGNMTVDGKPFQEIAGICAALIYPSSAEGTSGATVQAIHAGLFPIITKESGIAEEMPSIIISDPSVENIKKILEDFSALRGEEIKKMAHSAWSFARSFYSKEAFRKSYLDFIETTLKL